jgi:serine/threonine protein kinase
MSDDKDKSPPGEEERTVFVPGGGTVPPPSDVASGASEAPPAPIEAAPIEPAAIDPAATEPELPPLPPLPELPPEPAIETTPEPEAPPVAAPEAAAPVESPPAAAIPAGTAPPLGTSAGQTTAAFVPRGDAVGIKVGDVLNHIFEVKRFLARGGMGEVFEGCNVNTDEKVAIKVMLPALASDEKVIAMFRKEARTLTKLHHQALVQYRVLAQEPNLHVLYIVTDFIDGVNLSDAMKQPRTPDELAGLLRRLAQGLGAAHALGAVHRDMSPDNVILADGDIHKAKIIDFGIAKDLDASSATIVGDGFAGKLNYVAPEQLGDFGREVGPWTDVYSLALVILAVAQGKNVDMSGSLVDAIDKRRRGPDLAAVPDSLRPLLEAMLRPNPAERLRSMDDVVAMLDGSRVPSAQTVRADYIEPELSTPAPAGGGANKVVIIIVGLLILAAVVAGAWYFTRGIVGPIDPDHKDGGNEINPPDDNRPPAEVARSAITSVLPSVPCTWLDIGSIEENGGSLAIAMRGVAGDSSAAQQEIAQALTRAGISNSRLDFGDVAPITQAGCSALDTFRQVRANGASHLTVTAPRFEMVTQADGPYIGQAASNATVDLNLSDSNLSFALLGIEPSGAISLILDGRDAFQQALNQSQNGRPISDEGNGRYRLHIDLNHQGWSGLLLVTGQAPFDHELVQPPVGARGPDWQQRFLAAGANQGWRAEMAWFESVNREPDATITQPTPPEGDDGK